MLQLRLKLLSDATFSSGDGVAGWIDTEVEHDEYGFPLVRGRTLKGLLVEECANLLWSLQLQHGSDELAATDLEAYQAAAQFLFGAPGSHESGRARMSVGPAQFPAFLRAAVARDIQQRKLTSVAVLDSLTSIRRQSAVNEQSGAPDDGSLRALRVLLHDTVLESALSFERTPDADAQALLAACVLALRRGGAGRNRGRGRLCCWLWDTSTERAIAMADCLGNFPQSGGGAWTP